MSADRDETGKEGPGATPSQTIGPFFEGALVSTEGAIVASDGAAGEAIEIVGRVLDGNGAPVEDALVEIWHADGGGGVPSASRPAAPFRGFGRADTASAGEYRFRTVRPAVPAGSPPGTAPHVAVRVFARGLLRDVVTRMYFEDLPHDDDPVMGTVEPQRRATLVAKRTEEDGRVAYRFDIRLQGPGETVFFDLVGGA